MILLAELIVLALEIWGILILGRLLRDLLRVRDEMARIVHPPSPLSEAAPDALELAAERALDELPREVRARMGEVAIVLDNRPVAEVERDFGNCLRGLFAGHEIGKESVYPGVILLFTRVLACENDPMAATRQTVHHEIAHFLGMSHEQMAGLTLGVRDEGGAL